jgi:RNA polymerase subunit RPABC4/transcription elongation factor Spt4
MLSCVECKALLKEVWNYCPFCGGVILEVVEIITIK